MCLVSVPLQKISDVCVLHCCNCTTIDIWNDFFKAALAILLILSSHHHHHHHHHHSRTKTVKEYPKRHYFAIFSHSDSRLHRNSQPFIKTTKQIISTRHPPTSLPGCSVAAISAPKPLVFGASCAKTSRWLFSPICQGKFIMLKWMIF